MKAVNYYIVLAKVILQDPIIMQVGKIPKINKRAGWNKGVQVGLFPKIE